MKKKDISLESLRQIFTDIEKVAEMWHARRHKTASQKRKLNT